MKRRKVRYVDQRSIEACIEQLQAIIDGLRSGGMGLEQDDQSLVLRPGGLLDFELRVEQLERKETLRVDMSWRPAMEPRGAEVSDAEPPSGRRPAVNGAAAEHELAADGPITARPAPERAGSERAGSERAGVALPSDDLTSVWPSPRPVAAEYQQLYADACMVGSDGQWHIDRDQLVQSLARAGVDPLTQQELYSFALQADVDRSSLFSERVIAALERASQRPMALG